MITVVFEFFNGIIDVNSLIVELDNLIGFSESEKKNIDQTINTIKEYMQIENQRERYLKVSELLLNNDIYQRQMQDIDAKELMLLITDYLIVTFVPKISQETFDELANEAVVYDDIERVYRLANAYIDLKINISKLEDYIINKKNVFYIGQLMTIYLEDNLNLNRIVDKIIDLNDKRLMKKIINDDNIKGYLPKEIFFRLTSKK